MQTAGSALGRWFPEYLVGLHKGGFPVGRKSGKVHNNLVRARALGSSRRTGFKCPLLAGLPCQHAGSRRVSFFSKVGIVVPTLGVVVRMRQCDECRGFGKGPGSCRIQPHEVTESYKGGVYGNHIPPALPSALLAGEGDLGWCCASQKAGIASGLILRDGPLVLQNTACLLEPRVRSPMTWLLSASRFIFILCL